MKNNFLDGMKLIQNNEIQKNNKKNNRKKKNTNTKKGTITKTYRKQLKKREKEIYDIHQYEQTEENLLGILRE